MTGRNHEADADRGAALDNDSTRERRAAHERLSTGALARWMRACASHPWRVVVAWVGIIAGLILLVATVGGSLKDEFEIPGSDTQKATDLIESEFASEQGGVLNLVFAAPPGQRLDTPARKAAIEDVIAKLKTQEFKPTKDKAGIESVGSPFDKNTFSDNGRIAYAEAQFDRVIYDKDREPVVNVEDTVRSAVAKAGVTAEFNGDAEFRRSSRARRSCSACSPRSSCCSSSSAPSLQPRSRSRWPSPPSRRRSCCYSCSRV